MSATYNVLHLGAILVTVYAFGTAMPQPIVTMEDDTSSKLTEGVTWIATSKVGAIRSNMFSIFVMVLNAWANRIRTA